MTRVRGIAILAAMRFVKESYGPEAHERVLKALPVASAGTFLGPLRDASWKPLKDLGAYAEAARQIFAPTDAGFYRKLGVAVGCMEREMGGFKPMVVDPATAMRLAPLLWSALYDTGRVESIATGPKEALIRIRDFRTSRALCQSNCGSMEGLASSEGMRLQVEETACVLDGSPYCEMRVRWE